MLRETLSLSVYNTLKHFFYQKKSISKLCPHGCVFVWRGIWILFSVYCWDYVSGEHWATRVFLRGSQDISGPISTSAICWPAGFYAFLSGPVCFTHSSESQRGGVSQLLADFCTQSHHPFHLFPSRCLIVILLLIREHWASHFSFLPQFLHLSEGTEFSIP